MSRLYANTATISEINLQFGTELGVSMDVPVETIEGDPGLVVVEVGGRRVLRTMTWGFPRKTTEMAIRNEPPQRLGLLADLTNPMWERLVVDPKYRCLIPLTHFANPDGDPGSKTRTWFSVDGEPLSAWAGFCRNTPEFGPVYAGMTMSANALVEPYNDRQPALLGQHEYERWLHGTIQDVIAFQFRPPLPTGRTIIEHTDDRWRSGKPPASGKTQVALL
ncbi:MAG: SOS response-associated peptidase family protein [Sphingomonas sp.]|uniref:SOS response-associated peptidase family protein n=1 Tax=Sphingomonas sp. TaxID=28214 RepID=UPI001AC97B0A|nr:SOS response-associated peptidase family protein [Sphingomonas sp.]MBN8814519.1 SOS response-associated peptidase family protein [Sphingomonas sp.]